MEKGDKYIYDGNDDFFAGRECEIVDMWECDINDDESKVVVKFDDLESWWMVAIGSLKPVGDEVGF